MVGLQGVSRDRQVALLRPLFDEPVPLLCPYQILSFEDGEKRTQLPFLLHSNGHHFVMRTNPTLSDFLRRMREQWAQRRAQLDRTPVLLVESADHGACNVSTLGWLFNASLHTDGAPRLQL